jgi:hypothetical protein
MPNDRAMTRRRRMSPERVLPLKPVGSGAARLERAGAVNLPFSGSDVSGFSASFTSVDGGKDCGSWIWIVPVNANIVKVRAT